MIDTIPPSTPRAATMRAAVIRRFGGPEVVHLEHVPMPVPRANEVLIRVHATTVSVADYRMRSRDLPAGMALMAPLLLGLVRPRHAIQGMDAAGTIEAVGEGVTQFAPGDQVLAMMGSRFGGHAEYVTLREDAAIAIAPRNLPLDEAVALVFGGMTAMGFLDRAPIGAGTEVLVNGASGATGSAAVQLAAARGARVTGVCSAANRELVLSLGAHEVIDYAVEDFAARRGAFDVIVECVGNAPFERVESALRPGGWLLPVISDLRGMLRAAANTRRSGKTVTSSTMGTSGAAMRALVLAAEAGEIRPVIERSYTLDEIALAHERVGEGRKVGSLVVRLV